MSNLTVSDEWNLVTMFNHLWEQLGDATVDWFVQRAYICNRIGKFVLIKYLDHNKIWTVWGRQCRGTILMQQADGTWIYAKYMMQRGAELLGKFHTTNTSDMENGKSNFLSQSQQNLSNLMLSGEQFSTDTYLSMKCDGSLCVVTWYINCCDEVLEVLMSRDDAFSQAYIDFYNQTGKLIVISSQGTMCLPEQVQDYTVHAMLATLGIIEDEIVEIAKVLSPTETLKKYGLKFFTLISDMFERFFGNNSKYDVSSCSFNFETIVKNRVTAWGYEHTELAISYPHSAMKFLSATVCAKTQVHYYPHFQLPNFNLDDEQSESINQDFSEPPYWHIAETSQIGNMVDHLEGIMSGKYTDVSFFETFTPNNNVLPTFPDYEGFILYTKTINSCEFEYNKVKTPTYYIAHKLRIDSIPLLCEIAPRVGHIFPLPQKVSSLIRTIGQYLFECLEVIDSEMKAGEKSQFFEFLQEKAKMSFLKQNSDVQKKMLMNCSGDKFSVFAFGVFSQMFPSLEFTPECNSLIKEFCVSYCGGDIDTVSLLFSKLTAGTSSCKFFYLCL